MVNTLHDLMNDATQAPPEDGFLAVELLGPGRRRVRRRKVGVAAGVAAFVALAAAVPFALPGSGSREGAPARGTEPVGPVLTLDDATPAVEGRDYTLLTTTTNSNLDERNGKYFPAVLDDGDVLVQDGPHGIRNQIRWGLLDPETGTTDWFPRAQGRDVEPERFLGERSDGALVFMAMGNGSHNDVWTIDRGERVWKFLDLEELSGEPGFPGLRLGDDDRLYQAVEADAKIESFQVRSTSFDDPTHWRDLGVVGGFDVTGDELTWALHNRPDSVVRVQNLRTGEQRSVDIQAGTRCNNLSFDRVRDVVVIGQYCGTFKRVRDDRVQIVRLDGSPVVTIRGDGLDPLYSTDDYVVLQSYKKGQAGTFVYSFATGSLRRLSDDYSQFCCSNGGSGSRLTWSTPHGGTTTEKVKVRDGDSEEEVTSVMQNGNKLWVADFTG